MSEAVEVWWRNPDQYIKEAVELCETQLAWDRGYLHKKNIEPNRFADAYFPAGLNYRMLAIGEQGAAELTRGHTLDNPVAVYPVWEYAEDDIEVLEELLAKPIGDDEKMCSDLSLPPDVRPVYGQQHRVVVIRVPPSNTGPGRKFLKILRSLQEEYPDALIHLHGLYSYRVAFGLGICRSVDIEPRLTAKKGKVILPNGKEATYEVAAKTPHWVTLVGFNPVDLQIPRNRCMFNMKSALWGAKNFRENIKFRVAGWKDADPYALTSSQPIGGGVQTSHAVATVGDKIACNTCSLQKSCKYYRYGAVCSLPGSETVELARLFQTRDSDQIIEGLGSLLAVETKRLEKGLENEDFDGELDKEVTKILNTLFDRGVKLAKLINPALAMKANLNVNMNGPKQLTAADVRSMTAQAVAQIEATGVAREDITSEMVMKALMPAGTIDVESEELAS